MNNFKLNLGKVIVKNRKRIEISQEELAYKSNIHRTYMSEVEHGKRNISIQNLLKIAKSLNIKLSTLIEEAENYDKN